MNKYGGISGLSTANVDVYTTIKSNEGWTSYVPLRELSVIPDADCTMKLNNGRAIPVKADIGLVTSATQVSSVIIVEAGINYIMAYRF